MPSWLSYFAVESAELATGRAEEAGGRTLVEALEGPLGRAAVVSDPYGAAFGLLEGATDP